MTGIDYRQSGVDIDAGNEVVRRIKSLARGTYTPNVLSGIGSFGVYGATLTPFADTVFPGYFSPDGEAKRQAVNSFIRDSRTFDGVIDFDAVVRDPAQPDHIRPAYDFGDHLHPNDAGYKAMGEAVDLTPLGKR